MHVANNRVEYLYTRKIHAPSWLPSCAAICLRKLGRDTSSSLEKVARFLATIASWQTQEKKVSEKWMVSTLQPLDVGFFSTRSLNNTHFSLQLKVDFFFFSTDFKLHFPKKKRVVAFHYLWGVGNS